ncbi:sugar ABC transporter ATP-binding protein [Paraburkholderia sp.]|uniref:sugar ABC transporter ATP-binding protein n=1 Tax=Paraburkholderia sp. TaxID=1926495 RepID=UPI002392146F|nr:sugar ABC transporter ATP-binding protein [Paraburkholderia sp.]MDE1184200.1 sugar ABC transporter ATP-binding protein [Paraburkholderia sp.]
MDSTNHDDQAAPPALLSVTGLGKTYAEPVLADVSLALHAGEVLALTGENGAGKSTLSKIVGGLVTPSAGTMQLAGVPYAPVSRTQAETLGVRMVMQELNLLPTLSVAENLFLNRLPRNAVGWIDRRRLRDDARHAMAQVGLDAIDPDTLVGELGIGHQQMVEIARNLIDDCRVLILDEPTAMLTAREVDLLFEQIAGLKARGVALVYISHRLEELARIADRVAVLRDGRLVHVGAMRELSGDQLVTLMVGRELGERIEMAGEAERRLGAPLLRVTGLTRGTRVKDVSFEVRAGEIFGISGLIGAGRTELLRLIYGADSADAGTIALAPAVDAARASGLGPDDRPGPEPVPVRIESPTDAVRLGIALITEDRKGEGLLLPQSVAANLSLGNFSQIATRGVVDAARENALARRQIDALRIRTANAAQPVGELSGGNQQKVVIGRWLARDCRVLLFDEPTRGIDVGAKFDIYALLATLAREGRALVVVSSDLRELMLICDRIGVMSAGRMTGMFERGGWTQDALLAAALAGYRSRDALLHAPAPLDISAGVPQDTPAAGEAAHHDGNSR